MTTVVILVRHAQTISNVTGFYAGWSDEDLDQTGLDQARCLSSRLASLSIDSIYTSPLRRAYSTATILAEPHHLRLEVSNDLIEIKLGDWQGKHISEIKRRWPRLWKQSRIDPSGLSFPNGESLRQVTERAVRAFNNAMEANQGRQIVMVTHEAIIRVLIAHILGVTNRIYHRLRINNASLTVLGIKNTVYQLTQLNDTAHLEV